MQAASEFNAAQQAISQGFYPSIRQKDTPTWKKFRAFFGWMHIRTDLRGINDSIPFLQIFTKQVHQGLLAVKNNPIRKRSVEQYLRSIVYLFTAVGANKPRYNWLGNINFRLG